MKKFLGVRFDFWIVVFLFLLFSTLYSLLSVVRHNHFQSQGNDFSIYDQALWLYSRFERPYSTITFKLDLADRFRPIMVPISTLYWFTENERVILAFQAVALSAAVFPIWLVARSKLHWTHALVISFLYLDFVGIQAANVYDFHEMTVLPPFLAWLFYFLLKSAWRSYFLFLFLCLFVREHVGLILAPISIYVYFLKRNLRIAFLTLLIPLVWSIVAIGVVLPALGQTYFRAFVKSDDSFSEALWQYARNPIFAIESFFSPFDKIKTIFWSFFSFGFVPLFSLALLPAIFWQFATRFLDLQHPIRSSLYFHYSVELAVLLSIATIYGMAKIIGRFPRQRLVLAAVAGGLVLAHIIAVVTLDSPLKNLAKKEFWQEEPWMQDTRFVLSKVPKNASVETQNNLLPHLSHRREIYILPIIRDTDYIVFDLHPGQDNWNFYTDNLEIAKAQFKELVLSGQYKVTVSAGDAYLLDNGQK